MARVLAVGNATLDIVNLVERYPIEDEEVRASEQYRQRGGNTANTLVVLSQLGHQGAWAGTVADEPDGQTILDDLQRHGIDTGPVRHIPGGKVPTSYISLSRETGSRTIVHYRDLPEYDLADFAALDLARYDWLHAEGRNLEALEAMLRRAGEQAPGLPRSLEVEKPRRGIEGLFQHADVLLFSRVYAEARGFEHAEALLTAMAGAHPGKVLIAAWGDQGAWAVDRDGTPCRTPAFPPPDVVDTLGAGDVFNAGIIDGLVRGHSLPDTLVAAAKLAGRKCGQFGLEGLAD